MLPDKSWTLKTASLLLIAGLFWIWFSAVPEGQTTSAQISAPQKGFQAPDFTLPDRSGNLVTLSDFRGRPVLINIWASWCGPCRAEMPAIQKVYEERMDQGFMVLAVNATQQDSQSAALSFAEEHRLTFPILFDVDGTVSRLYETRALPSTFFVDPEGNIREVILGGPMAQTLLLTRVDMLFEGGQ